MGLDVYKYKGLKHKDDEEAHCEYNDARYYDEDKIKSTYDRFAHDGIFVDNITVRDIDLAHYRSKNPDIVVDWSNEEQSHILTDHKGFFEYYDENTKMIDIPTRQIYVEEIDYCRNTHTKELYKKFLGKCWYDEIDEEINEKDLVGGYVFKEHLDLLKSCFTKDSPIQDWSLTDGEFIYLCN